MAVFVSVIVEISEGYDKVENKINRKKLPIDQQKIITTLSSELKRLRAERKMTQEFVAESLGVTRQAVSKWENGSSEPSTSNLIAIAKLYDVAPEELLKKLI